MELPAPEGFCLIGKPLIVPVSLGIDRTSRLPVFDKCASPAVVIGMPQPTIIHRQASEIDSSALTLLIQDLGSEEEGLSVSVAGKRCRHH